MRPVSTNEKKFEVSRHHAHLQEFQEVLSLDNLVFGVLWQMSIRDKGAESQGTVTCKELENVGSSCTASSNS